MFFLVANFDDLYQRLGIPREECIAAWFWILINFICCNRFFLIVYDQLKEILLWIFRSLVNVNFEQQLGKDQCLVFLHILNQRSKGKRIPDSLPNALKTSLLRGKLNYNYNETLDPSWKSKTSEGISSSTRTSYGQSSHSGDLNKFYGNFLYTNHEIYKV